MDNNINTNNSNQSNVQNSSSTNSNTQYDYNTSKTAFIIKGIAICFLIANLFVIFCIKPYSDDPIFTFILVAISIFSFSLTYGFGEIINLLYEINKKIK